MVVWNRAWCRLKAGLGELLIREWSKYVAMKHWENFHSQTFQRDGEALLISCSCGKRWSL